MEDYDEFVQRCVSCLSNNIDDNNPSSTTTTSVIRFYGHPILPPLLTEGRRAEMQQHRGEAQAAAVHRRRKDAAKRDQLCKTPTLEVFPHESERDGEPSPSQISSGGAVLQTSAFTGANEHLLFSSPPEERGRDASPRAPLEDQDRRGGSPDDPGLSEALSTDHSLTADPRSQSVDVGGAVRWSGPFSELLQEGGTRSSTEESPVTKRLLVPSPSESKATHCAFYAAPQAEPQEKCLINQDTGQRASHPDCLHGWSHQSAIHDDLEPAAGVSRGRHASGSSEGAPDEGSVCPHSPSNATAKMPSIICYPPLDGDEFEHSGLESWLGYGFIISKGISHSLVMPEPLVEEKCDPRLHSTERKDDPRLPPVISHSRDHNPEFLRTHPSPNGQRDPPATKPQCVTLQALLRRSQEYRQHQQMLRSRGRNRDAQEKTPKRSEATGEGRPKEEDGTFIPAEEAKESWEEDGMSESQLLCNPTNCKSENAQVPEEGRTQETSETATENDTGKVSQEVTMRPQRTCSSPQQHRKGSRKFRMTRAATFWKIHDSGLRTDVGDGGFDEERRAKSPQQIDLIESSLWGLKAQILDLESTLKGNVEGHSPNESDMHLDLEYVQERPHVQASQRDCAGMSRGAAGPGLRRQLLKDMVDAEEDPGPEPSRGNHDPLLVGRKEPRAEEHGLVETLGAEEACVEEVLTGKGVLHGAQQDQVPEVFQSVWTEADLSPDSLAFPDASNHPGGENEAAAGCPYCQPRFLRGSGSELASEGPPSPENPLAPERGGGFPRVKLLTRPQSEADGSSRARGPALGPSPGAKAWIFPGQRCQRCSQKQRAGSADEDEQQKQAVIVGAESLPEERRGQREEPPQRPPDRCTSAVVRHAQQRWNQQPGLAPPEHFRPLLLAEEKGFLARTLLKAERLRTASEDGELSRQRERGDKSGGPSRKSCLSAATQKSLERKRERLLAAIKSKGVAQ